MSNKATLVSLFSQGDVPQGSDFANLINSSVNMAETAIQSMAGPLQATKLASPLVSAATINSTNVNITNFSPANLSVITSFSTTCDVSANTNNVYCAGVRIQSVGIVSALGTTQAVAAPLIFTMSRGQGATDGQTTGFSLLSNRQGLVQYLKYEGTVSANLWPPIGGTINNLSINLPFPLVAGGAYTIMHFAASAYAVK